VAIEINLKKMRGRGRPKMRWIDGIENDTNIYLV